LNTPSGSPACFNNSAISIEADGTFSDGFSTNVLPHASATGEHPQRYHYRKIERRDAGAYAERLAHRMAVDAGADFLAVFTLDEMRYAHRELDDFDAALHRAGGIGERLAVFCRNQFRQFVLVRVEQLAKFHQDARAAQRRRVAPAGKRAACRLHRSVDVGRVAERHAPGDLPRRRIGDVARARARGVLLLAVYPQRYRRHGFQFNRFVHLRSPYNSRKVLPCGAGMSRPSVQPPASGRL
jgi:hypothetical protein